MPSIYLYLLLRKEPNRFVSKIRSLSIIESHGYIEHYDIIYGNDAKSGAWDKL